MVFKILPHPGSFLCSGPNSHLLGQFKLNVPRTIYLVPHAAVLHSGFYTAWSDALLPTHYRGSSYLGPTDWYNYIICCLSFFVELALLTVSPQLDSFLLR